MFFRCCNSLDGSLFLFGILFIEFYFIFSFFIVAAVQRSRKKLSRKAYIKYTRNNADGYKRPSWFNTKDIQMLNRFMQKNPEFKC